MLFLMGRWDRIYEWQMILLGLVGIGLTVWFIKPGEYTIRTGFGALDPRAPLLLVFSGIALWSVVAFRRARTSS